MKEKLDIIFVYWKTDIFIKKCISQLLKTKFDNYNICIVDNTCNSKKKLKSYFNSEKVRIINGPEPLINGKKRSSFKSGQHHPQGLEFGIKATDAEYIAIFHCDAWPIDENWVDKCFEYLSRDKVKLVGLQHDSSIHASFHFFKRKLLKNMGYRYDKRKLSFGKDREDLKKYVKYYKAVKRARKVWDWGESLPIKIYSKGGSTIGINPTKGFIPYPLNEEEKKDKICWRNFGQDGHGVVYGDMFFHVWKTYRKHKNIKEYIKMYEEDMYLKKYCYIDEIYDSIVVNEGIHNNWCFNNHSDFIYK